MFNDVKNSIDQLKGMPITPHKRIRTFIQELFQDALDSN
jgi:hypothetical protein